MCNLSEGIEKEGFEKGLVQGAEKERASLIKHALQNCTPEDVSKLLGVPLEQVQEIIEKYQ